MNPQTELGACSVFDGMPQSASAAGGDDLISVMPDVLLHHVLGFLDAREAVQTCVIAKRWCQLWKSMPVLRVTGAGQVSFHRRFLDHLLLLRDRTNLEVCLFEFDHYIAADVPYVNLWIRHALLCQVRVLSVSVIGGGGGGMVKELWLDNLPVFSQYLNKLKLCGLCLPGKFHDFSSCQALQDKHDRMPHSC
nr:F-box/LRR-repeat protein 13-like [Setaria viridis]